VKTGRAAAGLAAVHATTSFGHFLSKFTEDNALTNKPAHASVQPFARPAGHRLARDELTLF
jgi:hypothetical protein